MGTGRWREQPKSQGSCLHSTQKRTGCSNTKVPARPEKQSTVRPLWLSKGDNNARVLLFVVLI